MKFDLTEYEVVDMKEFKTMLKYICNLYYSNGWDINNIVRVTMFHRRTVIKYLRFKEK